MYDLRRIGPVLLAVAFFATACSSSQDNGSPDASVDSGTDANTGDANESKDGNTPDAPDARGDDGGDAGPCIGPLNQSGCPTTYAGAQARCPDAGIFTPTAFATCGGLSAVVDNSSTYGYLCLYDGTGTLVGAQTESDIPEYCGNSFFVTAGNVPPACGYPWSAWLGAADAGVTHCAEPDGGPVDASTKD